jgi:hypothetical protein
LLAHFSALVSLSLLFIPCDVCIFLFGPFWPFLKKSGFGKQDFLENWVYLHNENLMCLNFSIKTGHSNLKKQISNEQRTRKRGTAPRHLADS